MAIKKLSILQTTSVNSQNFLIATSGLMMFPVEKNRMVANIGFYASQNSERLITKSVVFAPSMDGANFIVQAYEHIKTLPDFDGAVDC